MFYSSQVLIRNPCRLERIPVLSFSAIVLPGQAVADGFGFDLRHPADLEVFRLKRFSCLALVGLFRPVGRAFIGLALSQTIFSC